MSDGMWKDAIYSLPDGSMLIGRELKNLRGGKPYKLHDGDTGEPREMVACDDEALNYYGQLFTKCDRLGLPNGRGWAHEPEWLVETVIALGRARDTIEAWRVTNGN